MRVLFTSTPAYGHLQPMLPLAAALRAAGHEVAVAIAPQMCARAADAGLVALEAGRDVETWWPELEERNPERPWERLRPEDILLWFIPHLFVDVGARAMLDGLAAQVERWRPDLLVYETYELASPLVAAAAGIPAVHH
ncbi:MAG: glycosyltransferase, partial [Candidatus Dormibacteria bacterium]